MPSVSVLVLQAHVSRRTSKRAKVYRYPTLLYSLMPLHLSCHPLPRHVRAFRRTRRRVWQHPRMVCHVLTVCQQQWVRSVLLRQIRRLFPRLSFSVSINEVNKKCRFIYYFTYSLSVQLMSSKPYKAVLF
jgi:hypothetical protein